MNVYLLTQDVNRLPFAGCSYALVVAEGEEQAKRFTPTDWHPQCPVRATLIRVAMPDEVSRGPVLYFGR